MTGIEVLFLDIASRTGIAEGPIGGTPRLYTVDFVREFDEPADAFGRAVLWTAERLALSLPSSIYIEAPANPGSMHGHTNAKTTLLLIGLWAAVAGVCKARGLPCHTVHVATVRKWFLGQGNMKGENAKREAARISRALGWSPKNSDEADAAAGWHFACGLHGGFEAPKHLWRDRMAP